MSEIEKLLLELGMKVDYLISVFNRFLLNNDEVIEQFIEQMAIQNIPINPHSVKQLIGKYDSERKVSLRRIKKILETKFRKVRRDIDLYVKR